MRFRESVVRFDVYVPAVALDGGFFPFSFSPLALPLNPGFTNEEELFSGNVIL